MPFGSIFAKLEEVTLETADNKKVVIGKGLLPKLALKILGIPHIGLRIRANRIFEFLRKEKNSKILDAGCGPGTYSLTLASKGYKIYGFDINKKKISQAKKLNEQLGLNANFLVKDIYNLKSYPKDFFDIVICSDVLEHLKHDNNAVKELCRILKKNGKIIVTVPTDTKLNNKFKLQFQHEGLYTHESLGKLLEKNGLSAIKVDYYLCLFGRFAWRMNRSFFKSKPLTAITFYPLYALAFFDKWLNLKSGDGIIVKAIKK